ncbi:MAG: 4-(cytidine 5'-diphospho)-2-C-methyl-D-erythritol kinase [Melioribacteraceae bacterium]|nr:4-(cytidine 5'-diphospho)-2-C-methyl-D-erythritol kinase [Melioribacteraceae bacterium]
MIRYIEMKAPAKINIGLNIVEKRNDGFHNLETFFYPINDLHDKLYFNLSDQFSFTCNEDSISSYSENICVKAVHLLETRFNRKFGVTVKLGKNIPMGAGMGGGSSDAAAVLLAINDMFHLRLSFQELSELALELGSDVPFFLKAKPAVGKSRGEVLELVDFEIKEPILIVNPGIHISTKEAFSKIAPKKNQFNYIKFFSSEISDYSDFNGVIINDFEKPIFGLYPKISEIKNILDNLGAVFSQMTGTGSTVYGIFDSLETAELAKSKLPKEYFSFISKNE